MTFIKSTSIRTHIIQKSLLALVAVGLAFPSVSSTQTSAVASITADEQTSDRILLEDGTYLFGQSPTPDEVGSTYVVLSVENNQTVGAFYQPSSSFDCFSGEVLPNRLAVNVVDSYAQTVHPYDVALAIDDLLVAGDAAGAYTLEGFHRLESASAQDLEILAVCQADLAE